MGGIDKKTSLTGLEKRGVLAFFAFGGGCLGFNDSSVFVVTESFF
nr:MAG TPA: hypothetical protein [Caudoviricetes sp.]